MRRIGLSIVEAAALMLFAAAAPAQTVRQGAEVSDAVHFDVSPAVRDLPPAVAAPNQLSIRRTLPLPPLRGTPAAPTGPGAEIAMPGSPPARKMPGTSVNVAGLGTGFAGFTMTNAPSDDNIAVGPNHVVQTVNTMFAVFNKSGAIIGTPHSNNSLWAGFGGLCQTDNDGDVTVQYDQAADRWLITQFAVTGANGTTTKYLQCFAVSTTNDPTGTYTRYAFPYSTFNDYPKVGVWPDAYYVTYNMFTSATGPFVGEQVCALDRAKMLLGQAATQQCFLDPDANNGSWLPADVDGATPPPAGAPNYLVNLRTYSSIGVWKFHVDWTTPANSTLTGPTDLAVTTFAQLTCAPAGPECAPQPAPGELLDQLDDRVMYRLAYRNFGTHESLVTNHTIAIGAGGTGPSGVRWYEIRSPGTSPVLFQQGTYAPDSSYRFMGSIAMDQSGNMALGFSVSSASVFPQIHYTGRLAGDAAGTMPQGEASIIDGTAVQMADTGHRWGDYTSMRIDPLDDCTFWYTNQYPFPPSGSFNWATRIASFKFPSCGVTGLTPVFQSAVSRRVHGVAGTFDLALSTVAPPAINHNPTTEPRQGPNQTIVFTFDKPLNGATVTVVEGTATAGAPTFSGNDVVVGLTGVANEQYVTIGLTNVASTDGGAGGSASVRVGFLLGDVNLNRVISIADLGLVNAQLAQPVTAANYLKDVNASGTLTVADKGITNANLTKALPPP
jgi:hypothetical protein